MALPKTIGGTADRARKVQQERLALQKKVDALKTQEEELKLHGLGLMNKQRTDIGAGQFGKLTKKPVAVPTVTNWERFHAFISKHNRFDLLEKRPGIQACRDMWEEGEKIDGVDRTDIIKVTIGKA